MNKSESARNWLIILALLIVTGVVTAVWPLLSLNLGISFGFGPNRPSVEQPGIVFPVPAFLVEQLGTQLTLSSFQVFVAFVVILVSVVITTLVVGAILSFLIRALSKSATAVTTGETYQKATASLDKRQQEKLAAHRARSPKPNAPGGYTYQLDPVSFSLVILLFVALVGTLLYAEFAPSGEFVLFGQTFSTATPILIILFVITIPILAWRVRGHRLTAVAEKDHAPIPWDFIAVLVAGLLIVGVGVGLMMFLNNSA
ncbi:MAG: hypothetical protein IPM39_21080 [Chloroflexi bacterium]|nr:hypothetical protein [Chloroflexota bacterium]